MESVLPLGRGSGTGRKSAQSRVSTLLENPSYDWSRQAEDISTVLSSLDTSKKLSAPDRISWTLSCRIAGSILQSSHNLLPHTDSICTCMIQVLAHNPDLLGPTTESVLLPLLSCPQCCSGISSDTYSDLLCYFTSLPLAHYTSLAISGLVKSYPYDMWPWLGEEVLPYYSGLTLTESPSVSTLLGALDSCLRVHWKSCCRPVHVFYTNILPILYTEVSSNSSSLNFRLYLYSLIRLAVEFYSVFQYEFTPPNLVSSLFSDLDMLPTSTKHYLSLSQTQYLLCDLAVELVHFSLTSTASNEPIAKKSKTTHNLPPRVLALYLLQHGSHPALNDQIASLFTGNLCHWSMICLCLVSTSPEYSSHPWEDLYTRLASTVLYPRALPDHSSRYLLLYHLLDLVPESRHEDLSPVFRGVVSERKTAPDSLLLLWSKWFRLQSVLQVDLRAAVYTYLSEVYVEDVSSLPLDSNVGVTFLSELVTDTSNLVASAVASIKLDAPTPPVRVAYFVIDMCDFCKLDVDTGISHSYSCHSDPSGYTRVIYTNTPSQVDWRLHLLGKSLEWRPKVVETPHTGIQRLSRAIDLGAGPVDGLSPEIRKELDAYLANCLLTDQLNVSAWFPLLHVSRILRDSSCPSTFTYILRVLGQCHSSLRSYSPGATTLVTVLQTLYNNSSDRTLFPKPASSPSINCSVSAAVAALATVLHSGDTITRLIPLQDIPTLHDLQYLSHVLEYSLPISAELLSSTQTTLTEALPLILDPIARLLASNILGNPTSSELIRDTDYRVRSACSGTQIPISDLQECVTEAMELDDWGTVLSCLSTAQHYISTEPVPSLLLLLSVHAFPVLRAAVYSQLCTLSELLDRYLEEVLFRYPLPLPEFPFQVLGVDYADLWESPLGRRVAPVAALHPGIILPESLQPLLHASITHLRLRSGAQAAISASKMQLRPHRHDQDPLVTDLIYVYCTFPLLDYSSRGLRVLIPGPTPAIDPLCMIKMEMLAHPSPRVLLHLLRAYALFTDHVCSLSWDILLIASHRLPEQSRLIAQELSKLPESSSTPSARLLSGTPGPPLLHFTDSMYKATLTGEYTECFTTLLPHLSDTTVLTAEIIGLIHTHVNLPAAAECLARITKYPTPVIPPYSNDSILELVKDRLSSLHPNTFACAWTLLSESAGHYTPRPPTYISSLCIELLEEYFPSLQYVTPLCHIDLEFSTSLLPILFLRSLPHSTALLNTVISNISCQATLDMVLRALEQCQTCIPRLSQEKRTRRTERLGLTFDTLIQGLDTHKLASACLTYSRPYSALYYTEYALQALLVDPQEFQEILAQIEGHLGCGVSSHTDLDAVLSATHGTLTSSAALSKYKLMTWDSQPEASPETLDASLYAILWTLHPLPLLSEEYTRVARDRICTSLRSLSPVPSPAYSNALRGLAQLNGTHSSVQLARASLTPLAPKFPELLLTAAVSSRVQGDLEGAYRLAVLAVEVGGHVPARLELGEILTLRGHGHVSVRLSSALLSDASVSAFDRARVALKHAEWLARDCLDAPDAILKHYKDSIDLCPQDRDYDKDRGHHMFSMAEYCKKVFTNMEQYLTGEEHQYMQESMRSRREDLSHNRNKKQRAVLEEELARDEERAAERTNQLRSALDSALRGYTGALVYSSTHDLHAVYALVALWFHIWDTGSGPELRLDAIPLHKWLPLIHQLVSRLGENTPKHSETLQSLLLRVSRAFPHEAVYKLIALTNNKDKHAGRRNSTSSNNKSTPSNNATATSNNRSKQIAAAEVLDHARIHHGKVISGAEDLSEAFLELASDPKLRTYKQKKVPLASSAIYRLVNSPHRQAYLPTVSPALPIASMEDYARVAATGITCPLILKFTSEAGDTHRLLVKVSDDLRQDAVMQQIFGLASALLADDYACRQHSLTVRGYGVVPLTPSVGLVQWVPGSLTLGDYLHTAHSRYARPGDWDLLRCREKLEHCGARDRPRVYRDICRRFSPVLGRFLFEFFPSAYHWHAARGVYSRSLAVSSMLGHILGLGDRHMQNILLDQSTGEVIHIDLGIAFDQGKLLKVPEMVPFRLTRDMVHALGVQGVSGPFHEAAVDTLRVLRRNRQMLLTLLRVFEHDPLFRWGAARGAAGAKNSATRAIMGVRAKLQGVEQVEQLSVEGQVNSLVRSAQDPALLSMMFHGWSAFC